MRLDIYIQGISITTEDIPDLEPDGETLDKGIFDMPAYERNLRRVEAKLRQMVSDNPELLRVEDIETGE